MTSDSGAAPAVIAVDVGGTSIKGARIGLDGHLQAETVIDTPVTGGPDQVVRTLREFVRELVAAAGRTPVRAVGVVVPGAVDATTGIARFSANIGWRDVPLRALIADDTERSTVLDHDVRAAGVAEQTIGLTRDVDDAVVAVIGTGIAGALRADGRSVSGATGFAGELGHFSVWPDGENCPCGQRGCLERYASAASISRRYQALTGRPASPIEIVTLLSTDPVAAQVWDDAVQALAIAFAACTMLLDPSLIVLSGGLSRAGSALLDPVRIALAQRVVWRDAPAVELSPLGARAGLLGAGVLAARAVGVQDFTGWSGGPG